MFSTIRAVSLQREAPSCIDSVSWDCFWHRLRIGAFPNGATAPVFAFSFYAPVQKDSPVHILGLRYDHPTIEIDLENASGVPVDGIGIFAVAIAPGGCAAEPRKTIFAADPQVRPVRIGPRGFGEASGGDSMLHTGALVFFAKDLKVAYWHVQVGIAEVDFSDGTKWRLQTQLRPTLLDASLVAADASKCHDAAGVIEALQSIHVVGADRRVEGPSYGDPDGGTPAPLYFSCRLEGSNGTCPQGRSD